MDDGSDLIGSTDSILASASQMAERLFDVTGDRFANGNFVREIDADEAGIGPGLMTTSARR